MFDLLIVDDNMNNLKVLINMLNTKGYRNRIATGGKMAIKSVRTKKPDLILLDINMPDMTGYDVCRLIKQDRNTRDIPIIFISANTQTDDIVKGFDMGGADYITKPFKWQEVIARVDAQIEIIKNKREVEVLLSKTFVGSVQIMMDLLMTTKPSLFNHGSTVKQIMKKMIDAMDIRHTWVYEIAAMLSVLGFVMLPDEVIVEYLSGHIHAISTKDKKEASEFTVNLITKIPRLEPVKKIIELQEVGVPLKLLEIPIEEWPVEEKGAHMLMLIMEYLEWRSVSPLQEEAFDKIRERTSQYHPKLIELLIQVEKQKMNGKEMSILIEDLRLGNILSRDLFTVEDVKLLKADTIITDNILTLLNKYRKDMRLKEPVYVWKNRQ